MSVLLYGAGGCETQTWRLGRRQRKGETESEEMQPQFQLIHIQDTPTHRLMVISPCPYTT